MKYDAVKRIIVSGIPGIRQSYSAILALKYTCIGGFRTLYRFVPYYCNVELSVQGHKNGPLDLTLK